MRDIWDQPWYVRLWRWVHKERGWIIAFAVMTVVMVWLIRYLGNVQPGN